MENSNEQWLLDGICRECRRKDFCSNPCKKNKVRTRREMTAYIHARTGIGVLIEQLMYDEERRENNGTNGTDSI